MTLPKSSFLPIGLAAMLTGFILFIIYLGSSLLVAIAALVLFATAGILLVKKAMGADT